MSTNARRVFVSFMSMAVLLVGASVTQGQDPQGRTALERAISAQERHSDKLLDRSKVVGTGVGESAKGEPVLKVYTKRRAPRIPSRLGRVKVDVDVTGRLTAAHHRPGHDRGGGGGGDGGGGDPALSTTDVWPRPVPIGISTGNVGECSAGTIGARVRSASGNVYALSNNHVYALENDAPIGSSVLQPGRFDTGCAVNPANVIGQLSAYTPLRFNGSANEVDAAIARSSTANLGTATPPDGYGAPSSQTVAPSLGQAVLKYGRTTQLTSGEVTGINAIVQVGYSSGTARFEHQIVIESRKPFLKSGDSGSLAVSASGNRPVGLLYAGNSSGKFALANEIDRVLDDFGVTIDGG